MKKMFQIVILFSFIGVLTSILLSNTADKNPIYKILPADESKGNTSLTRFIITLKAIVANKDTNELFRTLDPNIIVSYGGGLNGIKEFSNYWNLNNPDETGLWKLLSQELKYGGTWEKDEIGKYFCIPYTHSAKAFKKINFGFDWYITAVCVDAKAKVYQREEVDDEYCCGVLNYDIVLIDLDYYREKFAKISSIGNRLNGYVLTEDLLYAADPHLVIRNINGNWKITAFAPFD